MNNRLKAYTQDSLRTQVAGADPYQLIQMLMAGAIANINYAKGAIQRGELENKAKYLSKSQAIIESLRTSLNLDVGGEVAQNLNDLYLYMVDRLADVSVSSNIEILDEVSGLVQQIKSAWDAIPQANRDEALGQLEPAAASGA
ncbi:flagellar export chaperone FliS [Idiomarina tyrosinivorans]|uniref:Flagellar secretion chaperone FliS n=1 Tax=Idiomarina tyrosinivorans TaxID=1445662 RepID=A0A432ZPK8_9GAMM|nr:flagellar export chaperone FliS [Idiomarina tyrosinivorans]RUO79827.1 flagellar export chaperone FliS [Idiomarina tyrosinivorans]